MNLIPSSLVRARTFTCRTYMLLSGLPQTPPEDRLWGRIAARSDEPLDVQINEWIDRESPAITFISPPGVSIYQQTRTTQLVVTTASLLYVPAVEGEQNSGQVASKQGSVGGVARPAQPAGPDTAGVYAKKGAQAGSSGVATDLG